MNLSKIAENLKEIMQNSADMVKLPSDHKLNIEVKSRNSLVTEIDKNLEKYFVEQLSKLIPEAGFIAEENTSDKKGEKYHWIIDPLDGTTNFIHGIPAFCASIALTEGNEVILGGILEFNRLEYFEAYKGNGAYLNGKKIQMKNSGDLDDALIATGFPYYDFVHIQQYVDAFKDLMEKSRGIRRLGSAALDLAYVACGRFDGFFEYSLHPWDVAAGIIIVQEAGGKVSDFRGTQDQLFGREIIASTPSIHEDFLNIINRNFH